MTQNLRPSYDEHLYKKRERNRLAQRNHRHKRRRAEQYLLLEKERLMLENRELTAVLQKASHAFETKDMELLEEILSPAESTSATSSYEPEDEVEMPDAISCPSQSVAFKDGALGRSMVDDGHQTSSTSLKPSNNAHDGLTNFSRPPIHDCCKSREELGDSEDRLSALELAVRRLYRQMEDIDPILVEIIHAQNTRCNNKASAGVDSN